MSMTEKTSRSPRRLIRTLLIAAALLAALTVTAVAAFGGGLLPGGWSNYFAPQWERRTGGSLSEGQIRLIDRLTVPVGQSVTADGITATVDSVLMGETGLWALVRMDGYLFEEEKQYQISESDVQVVPCPEVGLYGGQTMVLYHSGDPVTDGALYILVLYSGSFSDGSRINDGTHTLELSIHGLTEGRSQFSDGLWEFSIPLPEQTLPTMTASSTVITNEYTLSKFDVLRKEQKNTVRTGLQKGKNIPASADKPRTPGPKPGDTVLRTCTVTDICVNAVGIRFQGVYNNGTGWGQTVVAILKDGTEVPTELGVGSWKDDSSHAYLWLAPLELEDIAAIRIGENELPLG